MENAKKHTPGPWSRDDLLAPNGRPVIARTNGRIPISANTTDWEGYEGEDEANAALIAAAPELLEALSAILQDADSISYHTPHLGKDYWDKAREAVANARGTEDREVA